jgi:hypothetical protein
MCENEVAGLGQLIHRNEIFVERIEDSMLERDAAAARTTSSAAEQPLIGIVAEPERSRHHAQECEEKRNTPVIDQSPHAVL